MPVFVGLSSTRYRYRVRRVTENNIYNLRRTEPCADRVVVALKLLHSCPLTPLAALKPTHYTSTIVVDSNRCIGHVCYTYKATWCCTRRRWSRRVRARQSSRQDLRVSNRPTSCTNGLLIFWGASNPLWCLRSRNIPITSQNRETLMYCPQNTHKKKTAVRTKRSDPVDCTR